MSELADLAERLGADDVNVAGMALYELTTQGHAATPVLVAALDADSATLRTMALEGLATIADPSAQDAIRTALGDPDGRVRSQAAVALNRLQTDDALDALVATLDDWPDVLHNELSRSVYELGNSGPRGVPAALGLLRDDDRAHRIKGSWILRRLTDDARVLALLDDYDPQHPGDAVAAKAEAWLLA